jgi:PleD family two-component response regulator
VLRRARAAPSCARSSGPSPRAGGWSVGIAEWLRGEELSTVLARADTRLYEAKLAKLRCSQAPAAAP